MMSFMGRQFCSAYGRICANHVCYRAMNPARVTDAKKWGGDFALVSMADMSIGCEDRIEINES